MNKRQFSQSPAKPVEKSNKAESAFEQTMRRWLDDARKSNDVRDRIAVAGSISRGAFGSLHLGADCRNDEEFVEPEETDQTEFNRVA